MEKTGSFPSHPTSEGTVRMMHVVKAAGWGEEQKETMLGSPFS